MSRFSAGYGAGLNKLQIRLIPKAFAPGAANGTPAGQMSCGVPGGTWALSGSTFAINSATGAITTAAAVTAQTYAPTATYTYTFNGETFVVTKVLALVCAVAPVIPTMGNLTLSSSSFTAGAAAGSIIGAILGITAGGTVQLLPTDPHFAIDGSNNLDVGLTAMLGGTSLSVTIRETNVAASNGPTHDTTLTVTCNSAGAGAPYVVPGAITSPGTHLTSSWSATATPAAQGSSSAEGYAYPPAGLNWASDRFQESVTSGGVANDVYIGVVAAGTPDLASYVAGDLSCNMAKVSLAIGGGSFVDCTSMTAHPVTGKVAFWFRVKATDLGSNASGLYECRAIAYPKVGQCKVLQGPDPTSPAILAYQDVFSHYVVLDKGDLARQVIYKAANDGTTEAADTHAGTSGDPCKTWKRARALHRAHANYPSVLTTYALTSSQNHEWGVTTAEDTPVESTIGWTRIQAAPGLTNADVAIVRWLTGSSSTSFNIPCRKFFMKDVNLGDVPIYNMYGGDGAYNNTTLGIDTSFHFHVENIITTARPTTLVTSSADPNYNQPTAGDSFDHGIHCLTVEIVNCQLQYCANIPFYQTTFARDCTINHINNLNDMADNMRYCAGLRMYNTQAWNQANHLDALQPSLTPPNKAAWLEDIVVSYLDGNTQNGYGGFQGTMDGILGDDGHNYHNSVFLRLLLHTATSHDISMGSAMQNNRFINCDTGGQGIVPGWQFNLTPSLSAPCNNCWFLYDSAGLGVANFEMIYRKGIKHVYPFSARSPNPGTAIPTSTLAAAIGSTAKVYGIWDLDVDEFAMRVHHDDTWPSPTFYSAGATKIRGIIDANWPEVATRLNYADTVIGAQASQLQQGTASRRPATIEGTHRQAAFVAANSTALQGNIPPGAQFVASIDSTGKMTVTEIASLSVPLKPGAVLDYAGSVAVGTTIASQLSGTTGGVGVYQLTGSPVGDGATYIMRTGIQRTDTLTFVMGLNIQANTDTNASYFFHGGAGDTGKGYVGRQYIGGRQRIIFEAGQSQAGGVGATYCFGDSSLGTSGAGFPAIEGATVICLEVKSDRLTLTYWNAATGSGGYSIDAPYNSGAFGPYHQFINAEPFAIGSISGGSFGYATFNHQALTLTSLLGSTDKANVVAEMKARMGVS